MQSTNSATTAKILSDQYTRNNISRLKRLRNRVPKKEENRGYLDFLDQRIEKLRNSLNRA